MNYPLCFIDSEYYPLSDYPQLADFEASYELCNVTRTHFQFKVTGILCTESTPIIIFPKNYTIPEKPSLLRENAKALARTLIRYRNEHYNEYEEISLFHGSSNPKTGRIISAIQIIDDYRQNGYINREKVENSSHRPGRIDWPVTINSTNPIFTNKQVGYLNPIYRHRTFDEDHFIYLIHKNIVNECLRTWGWLYGNITSVEPDIAYPFPEKQCLQLLENELRTVFVGREIFVIQLMIAFLQAKIGNENRLQLDVLATPYFSFVWEAICGYLFDNQYPMLKGLLPQPQWESEITSGIISQRPDIFSLVGNNLYILDAKYYDFNKGLPGWHDVVKQFYYKHTLSKRMRKTLLENIFNGFILPGNEKEPLQYIGRVFIKEVEDLGNILAFAVNQNKAISTYAFRDDETYREGLKNELHEKFRTDIFAQ
ncbi:LlaJI family restriction endonuclease [bacterium]|nr:LlaJI family restriction endonuclease [bacterium]